jgi:protein-L-isoaspartate(D-aspartate) O-methyltransferase
VIALEEDASLIALAMTALAGIANVELVSGPLAQGWPSGAPYDLVFVEGAVEEIPAALAEQARRPAGRLVAVRADAGGLVGRAVLGEPTVGGLALRPEFDCAAPPLPSLRRQPGFVF